MELQTILHGNVVGAATYDKTVLLTKVGLEGKSGLTLIIDMLNPVAHHIDKAAGYGMTRQMNADAMGLHHGCLAIDVDDKTGKVVALTMDESVGVVDGIVDDANGTAHRKRRLELLMPKGIVNDFVGKGQHTDGYGAYLIMTDGDEVATGGHHTDYLALGNVGGQLLDGS